MKSLDKPTKRRDNLLNFKEKTAVPLNLLPNGKLPECLKDKTSFFYSRVFGFNKPNLSGKQSHAHLKPKEKEK
jgi:hypothetical protein